MSKYRVFGGGLKSISPYLLCLLKNLIKKSVFYIIFRPLTVHCSNGTGRTGTLIACDIAMRSLDEPSRSADIPQIVYYVRRGRASSIQTKEQYEFIYKVVTIHANKITAPNEQ